MTVTASYKELLSQREALEKKIADARREEIGAAVASIRELVEEFSLTSQDIFPAVRARADKNGASAVKTVPAKYYDAATGSSWTGRGKAPAWIRDKDRTQFLISS